MHVEGGADWGGRVWRADGGARRDRKAALEAALEDALTLILSIVNSKRDHIPPVVTQDTVTFPFEISIEGCAPCRAARRVTCRGPADRPLSYVPRDLTRCARAPELSGPSLPPSLTPPRPSPPWLQEREQL